MPPSAPPTPSKPRKRKAATDWVNDAVYGYIRGNNWEGFEINEVNALQKAKERLRGTVPADVHSAWMRGDVDGVNGLLVSP
jgi:hypothetical protein